MNFQIAAKPGKSSIGLPPICGLANPDVRRLFQPLALVVPKVKEFYFSMKVKNPLLVLVLVLYQTKRLKLNTKQPPVTRRVIFATAGIGGESLRLLSQTVAPELATLWVRWIAWASKHARQDYSNPAGLAIYRLREDPTAEPPDDPSTFAQGADESAEQPNTDDAPIGTPLPMQRDDDGGAADLWHATLGELQGQMTRATFDSWGRPTRAIVLADDFVLVEVQSPYAKEWLENRLNTTIERTVTGILGRAVQVRYVVRDSNPAEVQDAE